MPTKVKGQPPSTEIRATLKKEDRPVLVAYSRGKDAIAANWSLREAGIETVLAHMYLIPDMPLVEDDIKRQEDILQQQIHQYPHPSLFRWLNNFIFQPPERLQTIEAAQLPNLDYTQLWEIIKQDLGLPQDTWVADGVRAADSPMRRMSFTQHGAMKHASRKVSPVYDWLKADLIACFDRHPELPLPKLEYELFGRSFDGLDYRFLYPLKKHSPEDYQRILDWFPLADMEIFRRETTENHQTHFTKFTV